MGVDDPAVYLLLFIIIIFIYYYYLFTSIHDQEDPPAVGVDDPAVHGRQHEGADPGAADGDPRGRGALFVEVEARGDDCRNINEAEADSCLGARKTAAKIGGSISLHHF